MTASSPAWIRLLGRTGLAVSAITAGGGPIGGMPQLFGYDVGQRQGIDVVRALLHSPIRSIDTSNGYSDGKSEQRIGAAIREEGGLPDDFLVATKVDARDGDYSGRRIRDSIKESQDRLGLDVLRLVYLHDPEFHDVDQFARPDGAVESLVALQCEGVIDHLGVAGGHTPTLHSMLDLGVFEVLLTHSRLTLLDRGADELIDRAAEAGMGVVNAAVLGGGLLADRNAKPLYGYRPACPETRSAAAKMHDLADEFGVPLSAAAVQLSLRDPRVDTTVVGFSKPQRIAALMQAVKQEISEDFWRRAAELMPAPHLWLDSV